MMTLKDFYADAGVRARMLAWEQDGMPPIEFRIKKIRVVKSGTTQPSDRGLPGVSWAIVSGTGPNDQLATLHGSYAKRTAIQRVPQPGETLTVIVGLISQREDARNAERGMPPPTKNVALYTAY